MPRCATPSRHTSSGVRRVSRLPLVRPLSLMNLPLQVAGSAIPPKYLLVVVSQWHEALVVKCYDFLSGAIRQAERPDPTQDAALLLEFQVLSTECSTFFFRATREYCGRCRLVCASLPHIIAQCLVVRGEGPGAAYLYRQRLPSRNHLRLWFGSLEAI